MKRLATTLLTAFVALPSCSDTAVVRESLASEILPHSIETMMPGSMMVSADYIVWEDPFMGEYFLHVLDKYGKELGQALRRGNGPDEMITPRYDLSPDNTLFAFDLNAAKQFAISLDSLPETKITKRYKITFEQYVSRIIPTREEELLLFNPTSDTPFSVYDKASGQIAYSFGTAPAEGKIENGGDFFQGIVSYDPYKDEIIYSTNRVPYMAVYGRQNGRFEKIRERALPSGDYTIKNGEFRYDGSQRGARELAVCKDYIVTVDRDTKLDHTDEASVGRDATKLPKTVFVYNRDLELLKIVDTDIPLIRIAADGSDNTVYAIGIESDHQLLRFEIQ